MLVFNALVKVQEAQVEAEQEEIQEMELLELLTLVVEVEELEKMIHHHQEVVVLE